MNYEKTHFLPFLTKQRNRLNIQIIAPDSIIPNVNSTDSIIPNVNSTDSIIPNVNSTKFLGLTMDSTLSHGKDTLVSYQSN